MSELEPRIPQVPSGAFTGSGLDRSSLTSLLYRVRRRLWLVDSVQGLCWGLLAAIATMLIGMWFDLVWELPAQARLATWGIATVTLTVLLAVLLRRTWQAVDARQMARRIDAASGSGGELLNGYEFAAGSRPPFTGSDTGSEPSLLTAGLADMAITRAISLADNVQPAAVVSPRPAFISARWLVGAIGLIGVFALACPTLARNQWQRFASPFDDTPPFSVYQISVEPDDTEVLYGKGLEVRVNVAGPLAKDVHLMVTTGTKTEKVPMFPEANGTWRAQLSRLVENSTYMARVERARSANYKIRVITTPRIEDVQFTITPPAYTNDAATTGPLPKGGLVGLPGTRIQVTARSNRPLSGGEIKLTGDGTNETVTLKPVDAGDSAAVGEFKISRTAKLELRVIDQEGESSQEPFLGAITLITDQRPLVRILEPKAQSLATPSSNLPVVIDGEDDFGLARVELHRSLNDSRPLPVSLPVPSPSPRRFREHQYLALDQYELEPGDEIKLFARVTDNDPNSPKGAESSVVTVRIISQEEFERMIRVREGLEVLVSKYQQAERRLEKLGEELDKLQKELEKAPPESDVAKEIQEKLEELAKQMQDEADAIEKAAEHELPYDLDKNLKDKLTELAKELRDRGDELQKLTQKSKEKGMAPNEAVLRQLAKMAAELKEQKEKFDQEANEPLELVSQVYPLIEDEARFTALVLWQKDLAERLASFKDIEKSEEPAAKARLRDLQDEQRKVHEELSKLLDDIENHVRELPDNEQFDKLRETATKFAAELRASGAGDEMTEVETSLTDFRGGKAYEHAEEAARILDSFLSKCQGMGGEGGKCLSFNPSLSQSIGDSIDQLLADAGLSRGNGKGQGQGRGGYSTRSGNRNVGLYGGMGSMGSKTASGQGFGKSSSKNSSGKNASVDPADEAANAGSPFQRSASSAGTGPVPPQYRRRVNLYFQRVGEELEAAGK